MHPKSRCALILSLSPVLSCAQVADPCFRCAGLDVRVQVGQACRHHRCEEGNQDQSGAEEWSGHCRRDHAPQRRAWSPERPGERPCSAMSPISQGWFTVLILVLVLCLIGLPRRHEMIPFPCTPRSVLHAHTLVRSPRTSYAYQHLVASFPPRIASRGHTPRRAAHVRRRLRPSACNPYLVYAVT